MADFATHPRFYWRNDCGPGTEWIKFTKRVVPPEEGAFMARDDESSLPRWLALPGGKDIGSDATGTGWSLSCGCSTG